jgi:hypothetical protein
MPGEFQLELRAGVLNLCFVTTRISFAMPDAPDAIGGQPCWLKLRLIRNA